MATSKIRLKPSKAEVFQEGDIVRFQGSKSRWQVIKTLSRSTGLVLISVIFDGDEEVDDRALPSDRQVYSSTLTLEITKAFRDAKARREEKNRAPVF